MSVTQTVPDWTGFYHLVLRKNAASPTNKVFYLPSIDKSPTKISTVYEVLFQVKAKAEALSNTEADLVLDHAIYCKALLILMEPRNIQLKNFINLRMGGFHASCIFVAVIGKRFVAAGLKELCIEATLIRISSVESMIRGKQYNRRVRALKMVCEALQRLKIEAFERWLKDEQKNDVLLKFLGSSELQDLIDGVTQDSFQTTIAKLDELFEL